MIRHSVIFSLKHDCNSAEEKKFLDATSALKQIPGVQNFEQLLQVSPKNPYQFGLSMEFETEADYEAYNNHPLHSQFIEQHWIPSVTQFLEIDYKTL